MSKMAKKQWRYRKWPAWQKESSGFDKNEKLLVKYEYDYSSNNNQQLRNLCCSSLTVKHRIVDIAMKNIPVAAELLFARKKVFPRRDTMTFAAPPKRASDGHGTLAWPV